MLTPLEIVGGYHLSGAVNIQYVLLEVNRLLKPFSPFEVVTCLCRCKCRFQPKLELDVKDGMTHVFG